MEEVEGRAQMSIQVVDHVQEVRRATEKAIQKAARMIGGSIAGHAAEACPVDTGLLRNSITFALGGEAPAMPIYHSNSEDKNGKRIEVVEGHYDGSAPADNDHQVTVYVGTNVEYAPYQELGAPNANIDPRPFLRPAFENNREEIQQIIEKTLGDIR